MSRRRCKQTCVVRMFAGVNDALFGVCVRVCVASYFVTTSCVCSSSSYVCVCVQVITLYLKLDAARNDGRNDANDDDDDGALKRTTPNDCCKMRQDADVMCGCMCPSTNRRHPTCRRPFAIGRRLKPLPRRTSGNWSRRIRGIATVCGE